MGDPKKQKKKYSKPGHPWEKQRIEEENLLLKEYGLKNKREVWKARTLLKSFANQAKTLVAIQGPQSEREKTQLMSRLLRFGFIKQGAALEDVLAINIRDILERRLQTLVFRKGLARSMKQARQVIVHRHINTGDKKITSPSYLTTVAEEAAIRYNETSSMSNTEHAERIPLVKKEKKQKKETRRRPLGRRRERQRRTR